MLQHSLTTESVTNIKVPFICKKLLIAIVMAKGTHMHQFASFLLSNKKGRSCRSSLHELHLLLNSMLNLFSMCRYWLYFANVDTSKCNKTINGFWSKREDSNMNEHCMIWNSMDIGPVPLPFPPKYHGFASERLKPLTGT